MVRIRAGRVNIGDDINNIALKPWQAELRVALRCVEVAALEELFPSPSSVPAFSEIHHQRLLLVRTFIPCEYTPSSCDSGMLQILCYLLLPSTWC
jgi:hypothetical protein